MTEQDTVIVEAIRLGLEGESVAGIDLLIEHFPDLYELAEETDRT